MLTKLTRLAVTVVITVLLLQACVSCTTTKAKQSRNINVDSTYRAVRIDSSTVLHKYEGSANTNDKYERITTITPTIIKDSNIIRVYPTTVIREVGEKVTEIRYVDSSSDQRRVMEQEIAELKKQVSEKTKEKSVGMPTWFFIMLGLFMCFLAWMLWPKKKAT